MKLYCDNKPIVNIAHTKNIEIHRHFIKEKLKEGLVCMPYFPLEHQLVDVLTKWLNSLSLHDLVFKPGMKDIYFSALGGVLRCE